MLTRLDCCPWQTLAFDFVQEIDNDLRLVDGETIEMLPHRKCQGLFPDFSLFLLSDHGRRVPADAWCREYRRVPVVVKGGRYR